MTTPMDKLVRKLGDYSPISCERRDITGESLVEQVNRKYDGRHFFAIPRRVLRSDALRLRQEFLDRMHYDTDIVAAMDTLQVFLNVRKAAESKRK